MSLLAGEIVGDVIHTAGNANLVAAGTSEKLGQTLNAEGDGLRTNGLAGLPVVGVTVEGVTTEADRVTDGVAKVTVLNGALIGGGAPGSQSLLGVSALSANPTAGTLATVSVASGQSSPSGSEQPLIAVNLAPDARASSGLLAIGGLLGTGQALKQPAPSEVLPVFGLTTKH